MKKISFLVSLLCMACCSRLYAQLNIDKAEFRTAFVNIFQERRTMFDSIAVKGNDDMQIHFESKIRLPGASKCFIGEEGYNAVYLFPNADQCSKTYNKLREYLTDVASLYKSTPRFISLDNKPDRNAVFFTDSLGFTARGIFLLALKDYNEIPEYSEGDDDDLLEMMAPEGKPKMTHIIALHIPGDATYASFVSKGEKAADPALTRFIQDVGFNPDAAMKNLKGKYRKKEERTEVYESTKTFDGFSALVTETGYIDSKTVDRALRLYKEYTLSESDFLVTVEKFMLQVKSALPDTYCFTADAKEHLISFFRHPFKTGYDKPHTTIDIEYGPASGKQGVFAIVMYINRSTD